MVEELLLLSVVTYFSDSLKPNHVLSDPRHGDSARRIDRSRKSVAKAFIAPAHACFGFVALLVFNLLPRSSPSRPCRWSACTPGSRSE